MEILLREAQQKSQQIVDNVNKVIVGKNNSVELSVLALLAQGHLLIEDAPGVGKTMLARSLAKSVNCTFKRIQFTPDMLPSDITGVSMYNQKTGDFEFRPGPIMAHVVLADEINRATPKVQGALLECMDELQVTVDGITHRMLSPFHVLATENPLDYEGAFPLPETQLDRFLMRISLGYPSLPEEIRIMESQQRTHPIERIGAVVDSNELKILQERVKEIYVDGLVKEYIASLVQATRRHPLLYLGSSPRGSLALLRTSQARAMMQGRDSVLPDDVKALAVPVLAHRVVVHSANGERSSKSIIDELLDTVPVPGAIPQRKARLAS